MNLSETCCTKPPSSSDYVPKGKKETIGDFEVYIVGKSNPKATLFGYYDIFGYHNNTFLFCDRLAESGFQVVLPDFFRGKPWPQENFPPSNFDDLKHWAFSEHSWANKIKKDTLSVLEHLKKSSDIEKIGLFGFCWGGRVLFDALLEEGSLFQCGAALHPSGVGEEDLKKIRLPVHLILSKEEAGLLHFGSQLNSQHVVCKDYTDQTHGFCAARGDYSVKSIFDRASEANKEVIAFFKANLEQ